MKTYPMKARIRNEGTGPARMDIFDDIGPGGFFSDGVTAKDVAGQLAEIRGPLDVHISSSGGDVFDGLAIAEAIKSHKGPVTTYVDGIAASIASVIMQAGQKRVMAQGAMAMIHDAWGFPDDCNEAGLLKMATTLGKVSDNLAAQYASRAGGTPEQWRQAMKAETWYTADEAVAAGLADEVSGQSAELPGGLDVDALAAHAPARIMAALRSMPQAAAGDDGDDSGDSGDGAVSGAKCKTCDGKKRLPHPGTGKNGMTCPGCKGTGTYDPDGDGDDDSTAEGDTDHDYVLPDGSPGPAALTEERVRAIFREELRPALAEEVRAAAAAALRDDGKAGNPDYKPEDSTDTIFSQRLRQMRAALPALKGTDA